MNYEDIFYFSVAGESNTGKTGLVEKIIKELGSKGYRVASLKHTKGDYSLDKEGKDTWRHREAGSGIVIFSSPLETSFMFDGELKLDEILKKIDLEDEYDVLVIEGMKDIDIPKVSMAGSNIDSDIEYDGDLEKILDWIEDNIEINEILNSLPKLDCGKCGYDSCKDLALSIYEGEDVIDSCEKLSLDIIDVKVNGEKVPLSKFPSDIIQGSIVGMLRSLKGVGDIDKVEISFDNREKDERS